MKVSFSIPLKPKSGKHKFAMLLADEMRKQGVTVTDKRPDVNLVFLQGLRKGCKNIFRLDGVWMNTRMSVKRKNAGILSKMKACDGVVYQNNFCKQAGEAFIGKFRKHAVIMNGAKMPSEIEPYHNGRPYVLTFCRWRPHKRLKATVEGFLQSDLVSDYDLLVLGKEPDYVVKHPAVKYMGHKRGSLWSFILGSAFVSHLAYIDWCPNSVVESLVAGKNVLYASCGGTAEVVRDNGIVVKDREWDFRPLDLYDPPDLDLSEVAGAFRRMLDLPAPNASYLDISKSAKEYIKFCKEIVR